MIGFGKREGEQRCAWCRSPAHELFDWAGIKIGACPAIPEGWTAPGLLTAPPAGP